MREIALHLTDIAVNSYNAGADRIRLRIKLDREKNTLFTSVEDNGFGMDEETLSRCTDPFMSTRSSRSIGLGLALYRLSALRSGGRFEIASKLGRGTLVSASYDLQNIDTPPLGDIAETLAALMCTMSEVRIELTYSSEGKSYLFGATGHGDLTRILKHKKRIQQGINKINGGVLPI